MRPLFLSVAACLLVLDASRADSGDGGSPPQLPVGQTFKQFEFPVYQDGKLQSTLYAREAKGITLNRAETSDLTIKVFDSVTTVVTSPRADLYVAEQKMRTKYTVRIDRTDMTATSQDCDFDLKNKKYLLRTNVRVLLKHFDISMNPTNSAPTSPSAPKPAAAPPAPAAPRPARGHESVLDSPGSYSDTNSVPVSPASHSK